MAVGLVNAVAPHDDLERRAEDLAGRIIAHSPLAVTAVITAARRRPQP